ncbi:MAG TPA: RDD family protein [Vicinamibacterales bacterium]
MSAVPNPRPSPSPSSNPRPNPYAPPRARVRDIAAPKEQLVLAERSSRLGAAIVDSLIFTAMVYIPLIVGTMIGGLMGGAAADGGEPNPVFVLVGFGLGLVGFVVWIYMTLKQMSATGQSLAKKYFNIKVVRTDGSQASLSNLIWRRNVLNGLLGIIPLYGLIDVLLIFGEERKCIHDKIADTLVVEA